MTTTSNKKKNKGVQNILSMKAERDTNESKPVKVDILQKIPNLNNFTY